MSDIVASHHCMQFQGKRIIQTQENSEKPHFGPDLGLLGPNSVHIFFFFFFPKNLVTRYNGQLSSHTISGESNDPILRKLSEGQTKGRTDGRK